ncbi:MAG: hypothetical protein WDW38_007803 [Sanguina aurantia]
MYALRHEDQIVKRSDGMLLPAADITEQGTTTVTVGGGKVTLEHLGPGIVGRDGTLSRIANWAELSEGERSTAFRVIAKRNQVGVFCSLLDPGPGSPQIITALT